MNDPDPNPTLKAYLHRLDRSICARGGKSIFGIPLRPLFGVENVEHGIASRDLRMWPAKDRGKWPKLTPAELKIRAEEKQAINRTRATRARAHRNFLKPGRIVANSQISAWYRSDLEE